MKYFKIKVAPYDVLLIVIYCNNINVEKYKKILIKLCDVVSLEKELDRSISEYLKTSKGFVAPLILETKDKFNDFAILITLLDNSINTISHEISHFVDMLQNLIKQEISGEHRAYMIGYYTEYIYKRLSGGRYDKKRRR